MPVEITPLYDPDDEQREIDEMRRAMARWTGGPTTFLGQVPWPRSAAEVFDEYGSLAQMLYQVQAKGLVLDGDPARMPSYLRGVFAAASWTLGLPWGADDRVLTPVTLIEAPVTGEQIERELTLAGQIVEAGADRWPHCTGVIQWIAWVTGAPGRDQPSTAFRAA